MSGPLIARRYAEGLSTVIADDAQLQPALDALTEFAETYAESAALRAVLQNPAIQAARRAEVLDEVLRRMAMPEAAASFVRVLFKRRRLGSLADTVEAYSHECDVRLNRETADITTAVAMTAEQAEAIRHAVATFAGKSIRAMYHVDPSIVGGIVVRVGGFVVDRSVKRELTRLKREILERE